MTVSTRRWLFACLVLGLIAAPAGLLTLSELGVTQTDERRPDVVAAKWFRTLSSAELTQAQLNISQLPVSQQLFVVRTLTAKGQSEFWRSHLRSRTASVPSLSAPALSAIDAAIDVLSPEYYAEPIRFATKKDAAVARLSAAVDQRTLNELLYLPGETVYSKGFVAKSLETRVMTWLRKQVVVSARIPQCECIQENSLSCGWTSLVCGYPVECIPAGSSCWYGIWVGGMSR